MDHVPISAQFLCFFHSAALKGDFLVSRQSKLSENLVEKSSKVLKDARIDLWPRLTPFVVCSGQVCSNS